MRYLAPADIKFPTCQISAMLCSCDMYSRALGVAKGRRAELLRRQASVYNELAMRYMYDGQREYPPPRHTMTLHNVPHCDTISHDMPQHTTPCQKMPCLATPHDDTL